MRLKLFEQYIDLPKKISPGEWMDRRGSSFSVRRGTKLEPFSKYEINFFEKIKEDNDFISYFNLKENNLDLRIEKEDLDDFYSLEVYKLKDEYFLIYDDFERDSLGNKKDGYFLGDQFEEVKNHISTKTFLKIKRED